MMSEWQPIETAPTDGTDLLLLDEDEDAIQGSYYPENKDSWCSQVIELSNNWVSCSCEVIYPTHWMSLPKLPKN
ncbi:MAG TPA: DUF551 domain-containing protein [Candidatus Glassbacteria bacterium]|nr:DUF551 domain-containing protein [Candidatus Glassbacteria bacterium]